MGVKTPLTLQEANTLFATYHFSRITATTHGIIDTTYIVSDQSARYILKKFEAASPRQTAAEQKLLQRLHACQISVPLRLASAQEWHLYSLLPGETLGTLNTLQTCRLGQTLAVMHRSSAHRSTERTLFDTEQIARDLERLRQKTFHYYKKFHYLQHCSFKDDGIIHGDIFLDNLLFDKNYLGVIDFIDAGDGAFLFDLAVAAAACVNSPTKLRLLVKSYNAKTSQKITLQSLLPIMQIAADYYTLKRLLSNSTNARGLQYSLKKLKRALR